MDHYSRQRSGIHTHLSRLLCCVCLFFSFSAQALEESEIEALLRQFEESPATFMNQTLPKRDSAGRIAANPVTPFSEEAISSRDYVTVKDRVREEIISRARDAATDAPITASNDPSRLTDNSDLVQSIEAMSAQRLVRSELAETPWSDFYWPTYKGILGNRYEDGNFPSSSDWKENYSYIEENPVAKVLATADTDRMNDLSPSEKYELLVGDTKGYLTEKMWSEGQQVFAAHGEVESWFGICHGWAAASYMLPRPAKPVTLRAKYGEHEITFYPSDIKALSSLLWANSSSYTKFIGGRCNDKKPAEDENGRYTSDDCFDTNPGAWHTAVVNQIGIAKRSFILDASFDYEVWNQPVYSYEYKFFNPQTNDATSDLEEAVISLAEFTNDKFARYRGARTKYVVGIAMDVVYMVETEPAHQQSDGPRDDESRTVTYMYDLELDEDKNIIGGEWYTNAHPDFLWTPLPGGRAASTIDGMISGDWRTEEPVPDAWLEAAQTAGARGQALAKIVEGLIEKARR